MIVELDPAQPVAGFWQLSVLRAKIASMATPTDATGAGVLEVGLAGQSRRRRIVVRLHGTLAKNAGTT